MNVNAPCIENYAKKQIMMENIADRLRKARKDAGFRSAAEAANALNVPYPTYAGHENGSRGVTTEALEVYARRFKVSADWLLTGKTNVVPSVAISTQPRPKIVLPQEKPNATIGEKVTGSGVMVPVYGQAVGGIDGQFLMNGTILYEVMAPPQIAEIAGAYGVQISGDSMFPRYEDGEVAFVDPRRRVKKGDYVVAQIQFDEHEPPHAYVKRFVRHNAEELVLSQFNPPKELTFDHDQVVSVHFIALAGVA